MYEQNLNNLSNTVKNDLQQSKKKLRRLRVKFILKTAATSLVLIGGVVTTIIVPNPISGAIAIGAATVLSGSEGIRHTLNRLKSTKENKRNIKKVDKDTDELVLVDKIKAKVSEPSAPQVMQMYPDLRT